MFLGREFFRVLFLFLEVHIIYVVRLTFHRRVNYQLFTRGRVQIVIIINARMSKFWSVCFLCGQITRIKI